MAGFRALQLSVCCLVVAISCSGHSAAAAAAAAQKLQVYILAGQSNMVGHANFITVPRLLVDDSPAVQQLGQLVFKSGRTVSRALVDEQIAFRIERDQIRNDLRKNVIEGEDQVAAAQQKAEELDAAFRARTEEIRDAFAVSESVHIVSIADNSRRQGPLTVGFGANEEKIGPELGFGMSMAGRHDGPILLIKTSWGGKSLHYNFRPPSAGPYMLTEKEAAAENAAKIAEETGLNYRLMVEQIERVLSAPGDYHPAYDADAGYEIAGFVWFQGFNDQFSPEFRDNYRSNMVHFIKDVRKQFGVPEMPFVIGVLGTGITADEVGKNAVSVAQREAAAMEEFRGTVASVESYEVYDLSALEVFQKGWAEHFAEWCAVGSDRPYHYLGSGKFFVRFGDRLAEAMEQLQK